MHVLLLEVVALLGATVHTMEPATAPIEGATVLIEDGIILEVGLDVATPEGAETVDLTGLHLIPGLIDASATFDAEHDALYLSAGVTTVRDSGSPIAIMLPEASPGMRDRQPGPSLLVASPVFSSSHTATRADAFLLDEPGKASQQIAELVELLAKAQARVDYFAVERGIRGEQHGVVCAAAKAYGTEVWGPLPSAMTLVGAHQNGQRALSGLDSLLKSGQRFETMASDAAYESWMTGQVAALAQGQWRVAPFLMGTARISRVAALESEPAVLEALGGLYRTVWRQDIETFGMLRAGNALAPVGVSLDRQRAMAMALYSAGVQLVPASGAPSGGIAPGSGLVDELEEWSLAGVPAAAILELATVRAAEALGAADRYGRIAPELTANLIACASDPRRSVDALRKPEVVIVRGRVLERFHLDDAVAALAKRQSQIEDQRSRTIVLERPPMPEGESLVEGTANFMAYKSRSAIERYSVVKMADGTMVYGARVMVLATGKGLARELVLVQSIRDGLVQHFNMTLSVLDAQGQPVLNDEGAPAFEAKGLMGAARKKLTIDRFRDGQQIDSKAGDESIAAVDGSTILLGLIGAMHFPEGHSFVVGFDGVAMEPLVDRVRFQISAEDGRLSMDDTRGARVFGFGPGGELRFAARAQTGGRMDLEPGTELGEAALSALDMPAARLFKGDATTWFRTGSKGASVPVGPVEVSGATGDGKAK